jgi:hypothetical protein
MEYLTKKRKKKKKKRKKKKRKKAKKKRKKAKKEKIGHGPFMSQREKNEKKTLGEPGKKEESQKDNQLMWLSM